VATLRELEDRYQHELLNDEERQELLDRVLRLRRRLGISRKLAVGNRAGALEKVGSGPRLRGALDA
jgi:hypothetical protein